MAEDRDEGVAGEKTEDRYVGGRDLASWQTRPGRWLAGIAAWLGRFLGPYSTLVLIIVVGAGIAALAVWGASEVYDAVTEVDGVAALDQPVLMAMVAIRTPWLDDAANVLADVGGTVMMPIIAVVIMLTLAIKRRSWTPIIIIGGAGLGSVLMTVVGKDLVGRARPDIAYAVPPYQTSPSFPSGHTLNATVVAGAVAYVLILRQSSRIARVTTIVIAAAFAFLMGISRVYLGQHWLTDVLAAWLLGVAWLAVVITAHRMYLSMRSREQASEVPATA